MTEMVFADEIAEDGTVVYEMDTEIAIEYTDHGLRSCVEIGVEAGDNIANVYVEALDEDGNIVGGHMRLDADELRALIAAAEMALDTVEANS